MNTESRRTANTAGAGSAMLSPNRAPRTGRKQPNEALLHLLRLGMMIACGIILILGLLLLILPMFRVQSVEIVGNQYYTAEDIRNAASVREGDEILAVDLNGIVIRILKECPNVDSVSVSRSFPFQIKITITEKSDVMYAAMNDHYYSFDRNFRVLEVIESGETRFSPFLYVQLPAVASAQKGAVIRFSNPNADLSYIHVLVDALKEAELPGELTSADFSDRFSVSFILSERCRVELGKVENLQTKFLLVKTLLEQKGGVDAACAVVDVSAAELSKATYRIVNASEL